MVSLANLWLPILVSAAAVWIASAIAWIVMPHHKGEHKPFPDEDAVLAAIRGQNVPPGIYAFPDWDPSKSKDPAFIAKMTAGAMGMVHVWPANAMDPKTMGGKMIMTFSYCIIVSALLAYLGTMALPKGVEFMHVFRFIGTAGIMSYTLSRIPIDICFNTPRRNMIAAMIDGIAFGLITGAVFGWLWPHAV